MTVCHDHEVVADHDGAAEEQRHALAMAVATTSAAQAAVEVVRLSTHSSSNIYRPRPSIFVRDYAAIAIQTAFRGYLVTYLIKLVLVSQS